MPSWPDGWRELKGEKSKALRSLEKAISEARKYGFANYQLEARLAIGEIELKAGQKAAGRIHLQALERDARAKGFGLIARKAAAAAKG